MYKKPKKPKKLFAVLIVVFVISISTAIFLILNELHNNSSVSKTAQRADKQEQPALPSVEHIQAPTLHPKSNELTANNEEENSETYTPREIREEFLTLRETFNNDDIMGHLWIDGMTIDYLVVQAKDNSFYLEYDIHKNPSSSGWIFLDYEVSLDRKDQNIVIYGHNMRSGAMFHDIRFFADYDFFLRHPIINFNTIYEDTQWEIFAFYQTDISFPYTHINYADTVQWAFMLERFKEMSIYDTGITPTPQDRILTLSTCTTGINRNMRYVLQARLIHEE